MEACKILNVRGFNGGEGKLNIIESKLDVSFDFKRIFYIYNVDKKSVRGQHANKNSKFIMVALQGSCKVMVDDGFEKETFFLENPSKSLVINNMTWKEMNNFTEDCILLVMSDYKYDKEEYINNYDEFLIEVVKRTKEG